MKEFSFNQFQTPAFEHAMYANHPTEAEYPAISSWWRLSATAGQQQPSATATAAGCGTTAEQQTTILSPYPAHVEDSNSEPCWSAVGAAAATAAGPTAATAAGPTAVTAAGPTAATAVEPAAATAAGAAATTAAEPTATQPGGTTDVCHCHACAGAILPTAAADATAG